MKLQFLGAAETVTGSRYLIEDERKKLLVDCGLFQGLKKLRLQNWETFPVEPGSIDEVILTHAHIDHTGYLPLLVKQGFKGPIYCTKPTRALCEILLADSGRIHEEDARRANHYGYSKHQPALPLYTEEEARASFHLFKEIGYGQIYEMGTRLKVNLFHAGHLLGASMVQIRRGGTTILFTGDLGRSNDPVIKPPSIVHETDYLVLDSTYGNRLHVKENPKDQIERIVNRVWKRGGHLLIPAFAVGRTQTVLFLLWELLQEKRIPEIPIYLDSPMAHDATGIFETFVKEHKLPVKVCAEVCSLAEFTRSVEESKKLDYLTVPSIIISASGMLEGGRILHHLKHYCGDRRNAILFSGFQAAGTRGAKVLSGEKEIKIHGEFHPFRAEIDELDNLSSHSDYTETLEWLGKFRKAPREVFLTHGEPEALENLKGLIEERFDWRVRIPSYLDSVDL